MATEENNNTALIQLEASKHGLVTWKNVRGLFYDRQGNPRRVGVGPNGGSDLIGFRSLVIKPEHVGQKIAQLLAIEVKTEKGRVSPEQKQFIEAIVESGGLACVARGPEDIHTLLTGNGTFI